MQCLRKGWRPKGVPRALDCGSVPFSVEELRDRVLEGLDRLLREQLGHARRAGAVVWGAERVGETLEAGGSGGVLIAVDAAQRTTNDMIGRAGMERVYRVPAKAELGEILGPAEVGVATVTHPRLADQIQALAVRWNRLREENGDGQG